MFRKTIYGTCVQFRTPEIPLKSDGNSASVGRVLDRRNYHRQFFARTAARRRKLANHSRQSKRWTAWLLNELFHNWPPEPRAVLAADLRDSLLEYR